MKKKKAITLRCLATGESLNSLKYQFRVHEGTIGKSIITVCKAIFNVLVPDHIKCISREEEWEYIIDQTNNRWQFPNCYTATDGKHIAIIRPTILLLERLF